MSKKDKIIRDLKKVIEEQQRKIDDLEAQLLLFTPLTMPINLPLPQNPHEVDKSWTPNQKKYIYGGDDSTHDPYWHGFHSATGV